MGAETFQRPGKAAAGSRHEPGVARQAVTAAEPIGTTARNVDGGGAAQRAPPRRLDAGPSQ
jgi:hypothetical protein